MASELRVNTLKDAAGANSVAMTYVAGGSAKAWVNLSSATEVTASLNISSATDNGTGDYTATMTNSFSGDGTLVGTGSGGVVTSSSQDRTVAFFPTSNTNELSLILRIGSTLTDMRGGGSAFGDLA